jgi:hypothetical protein
MVLKFKKGDIVRCIDAAGTSGAFLSHHALYKVRRSGPDYTNVEGVTHTFFTDRFEKVSEEEAILYNIKKEIYGV